MKIIVRCSRCGTGTEVDHDHACPSLRSLQRKDEEIKSLQKNIRDLEKTIRHLAPQAAVNFYNAQQSQEGCVEVRTKVSTSTYPLPDVQY